MRALVVSAALVAVSFAGPAAGATGSRVACLTDEGESSFACVWDARHQGNGLGRSFVIRDSGRLVYVSHARAHFLLTGVIL